MQNLKQNLIAIPGNSFRNKGWINDVAKSFGTKFHETHVHHYRHWEDETGNTEIDFEYEANTVHGKVKEWDEFTVFAKSAGTLVTLMNIKSGKMKPQMAIFVGLPMNFAKAKDIDLNELIRDINVPLIFIQQKYDPQASATEVENFLKDKGLNYKFVGIEGDDHHYENIELLKEIFLTEREKLLKQP